MLRTTKKWLPIAAVVFLSSNAYAIQKDITVNAEVDSNIDITKADGTALPSVIDMQYLPGTGLADNSIDTKIWSNDLTKNINIRLLEDLKLVGNQATPVSVPMTLELDGVALTTSDKEFTASKLFPTDTVSTGSITMPLKISQTTKGVLETGKYTGIARLMLAQKTTTK